MRRDPNRHLEVGEPRHLVGNFVDGVKALPYSR